MTAPENRDESAEIDPRVELSETLHEFFIDAIIDQRGADERREARRGGRRPAGSLYKVESGFLKIHLQPPAADIGLGDLEDEPAPPDPGPNVWLLLPLGGFDGSGEIIDEVLSVDSIIMRVLPQDPAVPPVTYLVENERFSLVDFDESAQIPPPPGSHLSIVESEVGRQEKEREEQGLAQLWVERLGDYDLRTITTTRVTAA